MKRLTPDKLKTTFMSPVTEYGPIQNRKYTLTHSDTTGMLFLDIGNEYNYSAINKELRDEVLGRWIICEDIPYILLFYVHVGDGNFDESLNRYNIFKSHLDSALQAIIYGDSLLLDKYPELMHAPIYVKFDSIIPNFDNYEDYGCVKDYM
ncbi:staygreen family protein [Intestinibacter sp.]